MDPLLRTVILFAGNIAPKGGACCQGQLLPITGNSALFSILGTTYDGNGVVIFALHDLRGKAPGDISTDQPSGLHYIITTESVFLHEMINQPQGSSLGFPKIYIAPDPGQSRLVDHRRPPQPPPGGYSHLDSRNDRAERLANTLRRTWSAKPFADVD